MSLESIPAAHPFLEQLPKNNDARVMQQVPYRILVRLFQAQELGTEGGLSLQDISFSMHTNELLVAEALANLQQRGWVISSGNPFQQKYLLKPEKIAEVVEEHNINITPPTEEQIAEFREDGLSIELDDDGYFLIGVGEGRKYVANRKDINEVCLYIKKVFGKEEEQ